MSIVATAPVLVPLVTAGLTALAAGRARTQQAISFVGVLGFLGAAVVLLAQVNGGVPAGVAFGDWSPPYGIQFQLDRLSSLLVLVTALMGLASLLFLASDADPGPRHPLVLPLVHGTLAGVAGAFSTADLFNLYVWFEVMLICALGLIAIGGRRDQLDAAFKYLVLNLFGTLLLLAAVGLLYAATGQLNYDALALASRQVDPGLLHALLAALAVGLLLKSAAFPLYAWLPASYPTLPAPVLALFAGLLTKVGVYAVLRTAQRCSRCWAGWPPRPWSPAFWVRPITGTCGASWPSTSSARSATSCWRCHSVALPATLRRSSIRCTTWS